MRNRLRTYRISFQFVFPFLSLSFGPIFFWFLTCSTAFAVARTLCRVSNDIIGLSTSLSHAHKVPQRSNPIRITSLLCSWLITSQLFILTLFGAAEFWLCCVNDIGFPREWHKTTQYTTTTLITKTETTQRQRHESTTQRHVKEASRKRDRQKVTDRTGQERLCKRSIQNVYHSKCQIFPSTESLSVCTLMKVTCHPLPLDNEWKATPLKTETSSETCKIFCSPAICVPLHDSRTVKRHMYRITHTES